MVHYEICNFPIGKRGQFNDAYKALLAKAKAATSIPNQILTTSMTKKEDKGENWLYTYEVTPSDISYTVSIDGVAPSGTLILNQSGESFNVSIPKASIMVDCRQDYNWLL